MTTARAWYEHHGLPFPPLPPSLEDDLRPVTDTSWATAHAAREIWDTKRHAEAAAEAFPPAHASIGAAGRGMASNALYCNIVTEHVAIFMEHAIGNVDDDPEAQAAEIAVDYAVVSLILERAAARDGDPIVVLLSTLRLDAAIHHEGAWTEHRTFDLLHDALSVIG